MPILKSKIREIIDKSKKQGRYKKYSKKEKERINNEIGKKMEVSRLEYLKWESESIVEASNCLINA